MGNWKEFEKNIGIVYVNRKVDIYFYDNKELPVIKSITSSCGCSSANYDVETKRLSVNYKPGSIPTHLLNQGYYTTTKYITVTYEDDSKDILSFTAKVYKK